MNVYNTEVFVIRHSSTHISLKSFIVRSLYLLIPIDIILSVHFYLYCSFVEHVSDNPDNPDNLSAFFAQIPNYLFSTNSTKKNTTR